MRLAPSALWILGLCASFGCGWFVANQDDAWSGNKELNPVVAHEATIDLAPAGEWSSHLGQFPPTERVQPEMLDALGIKSVDPSLLAGVSVVETRRTSDGSYVTQIGDSLFLTQRPLDLASTRWTLRVPPEARGRLRVAAVSINGHVGLAVEHPDNFARLAWSDSQWSFVLFDVGRRWGLERLVTLAESLR